ncbi:MAG TPA: class I SAM-dependent methyltransferase [Chitinophagaceae bacterium]|nr:class I SAM-dependent methyltransferase [Chitinophagaceae bacterium]
MIQLSDPSKRKAAATYNAAADHFDDAALSFWDRFGRSTVEQLALRPGMSVLDVACGSGASALPAALAVGTSGRVVGIDLAENLLELGRAKAGRAGLSQLEFFAADMTDLPFPEESFDVVVCVFGVFFVADMASLIRGLWSRVKPGGQLAITTWGPRLFSPIYEVWKETVREERPDLYSAFNPWDRITTTEAVEQLFRDAGIAGVRVLPQEARHPLATPEDWWTIVKGSGFRWTIDQMGPEAAERVRRKNIAWLDKQGIPSLEVNVIYAVADKLGH